MSDVFSDDPGDRKRRFLRGLNSILGPGMFSLENKDREMKESSAMYSQDGMLVLRNNLASIYGLEFTEDGLYDLLGFGITTGKFTEIYCPIIYDFFRFVNPFPRLDINWLLLKTLKNDFFTMIY